MRFDPATDARTTVADWTGEPDAREIDAEVRGIAARYAPSGLRVLLESTPVYMAPLFGATGHTAEEAGDPTRFVIYLDPYRATGRLHAASTLVHELTHVRRCRARGFHANRAAAVLPKEDFVLLGLADEFAAYQVEAAMLRSFLDSNAEVRRAAPRAMRSPELRWPPALAALLGFGSAPAQARSQVVLDLARIAANYWEARHAEPLGPALLQTVRRWHGESPEWQRIASERPKWGLRKNPAAVYPD